jgi:hypothetical protein
MLAVTTYGALILKEIFTVATFSFEQLFYSNG